MVPVRKLRGANEKVMQAACPLSAVITTHWLTESTRGGRTCQQVRHSVCLSVMLASTRPLLIDAREARRMNTPKSQLPEVHMRRPLWVASVVTLLELRCQASSRSHEWAHCQNMYGVSLVCHRSRLEPTLVRSSVKEPLSLRTPRSWVMC